MPTKTYALKTTEWTQVSAAPTGCLLQSRNGGVRLHVGTAIPAIETADFMFMDHNNFSGISLPTQAAGSNVYLRAVVGDRTKATVIADNVI